MYVIICTRIGQFCDNSRYFCYFGAIFWEIRAKKQRTKGSGTGGKLEECGGELKKSRCKLEALGSELEENGCKVGGFFTAKFVGTYMYRSLLGQPPAPPLPRCPEPLYIGSWRPVLIYMALFFWSY